MKCMHCLTHFHDTESVTFVGTDADKEWVVAGFNCPACHRLNLFLRNYSQALPAPYGYAFRGLLTEYPIRPRGAARPPCPTEVPREIAEDYNEACLVLPDSLKASAALSRRCLQSLLRDKGGVKPDDLSKEIQQVIDSHSLPTYLSDQVDAIRNIGNFAAHPLKSKSTGEILPVEPGEAEWNLDVVEALFDFYYVQPTVIANKRAALNDKLKEAGKPPMK
jgi:Domain of unknown function (DUF4145)